MFLNKRILALSLLSMPLSANAQEARWVKAPLGISFAVSAKFKDAQAAESATLAVVNWRATAEQGLIATCFVQAHAVRSSMLTGPLSRLDDQTEAMKAQLLARMRERGTDAAIEKIHTTVIDGLPAFFVVRSLTTQSLDSKSRIRVWSVFTRWKDRDITFECGSTVPHQFPNHEAARVVETEVINVLRTLHFER